MRIIKIVLTGGPCAGKTALLNALKEYFKEKKIKLLIGSETATELKLSGISFEEVGANLFQKMILKGQCNKELLLNMAACSYKDEPLVIILYDRGILDNKAYLKSQEEFDKMLKEEALSELDILENYDLVIDLISTAVCNPKKYQTTPVRNEDINSARLLDQKTSEAWIGHRNMKVFNSNIDLEQETKLVIAFIKNFLNNNVSKKIEKFYVNNDPNCFKKYNDNNSKLINVKEVFLDSLSGKDCCFLLKEKEYKGFKSYLLIVKKCEEEKEKIIYEKRIDEKAFLSLKKRYQPVFEEKYKELSFIEDRQIYKVKFYKQNAVLEFERNELNENLSIPNNIEIIDNPKIKVKNKK